MRYPVKNVSEIKRACNPEMPLEPGDERYVELWPRPVDRTFAPLYNELADACAEEYLKRCISGHRGSGKSTQLLRLADWANKNAFLAYRVEVTQWFGSVAPLFSELFLLAAFGAAEAMREFGTPLPDERIEPVISWFHEITQEDRQETKAELKTEAAVQGEAGVPLLGKLLMKFTVALQGSSSHAQTVREKLRAYPDALLDLTMRRWTAPTRSFGAQGATAGWFDLRQPRPLRP